MLLLTHCNRKFVGLLVAAMVAASCYSEILFSFLDVARDVQHRWPIEEQNVLCQLFHHGSDISPSVPRDSEIVLASSVWLELEGEWETR